MPYSPVVRYVFQKNMPPSSGSECAGEGCTEVLRKVASQSQSCEEAEGSQRWQEW
jgi:hypothetical protein